MFSILYTPSKVYKLAFGTFETSFNAPFETFKTSILQFKLWNIQNIYFTVQALEHSKHLFYSSSFGTFRTLRKCSRCSKHLLTLPPPSFGTFRT
jgi:hypothetical protein